MVAFYLKAATDSVKHNATIYLSQYGSDASPAYTIRHPDPALPASKNRYAVALYDSYNPDIVFGEVLLIPKWTQPSLSAEEIRQNGGVSPPPQPILPDEFVIQLYNPDQQVSVKQHAGSWNTAPYWDFEMPQQTFRQPSTSALDRTQSDPTASETTPKINFKWKKDGKLSKDLVCNLSGKSSNLDGSKKRNREPDIAISLFRHLREITIYESNLSRVEMEDPKGLEVVLLLSAVVIREVFFGQMKEVFNITEAPKQNDIVPRRSSGPRIQASVPQSQRPTHRVPTPKPSSQGTHSSNNRPALKVKTSNPQPPPTDPRSEWEIDAETARLKKQVEHEERVRKRAEYAEMKRVKKMVEAEDREAKRKQVAIEAETERLKKEYAAEQRRSQQRSPTPTPPPRHDVQRHSAPLVHHSYPGPQQHRQRPINPNRLYPGPQQNRPHSANRGQYLQPPGGYNNPSSSGFFSGPSLRPEDGKALAGRKSFFGLRSLSDDSAQRVSKKKSSIF